MRAQIGAPRWSSIPKAVLVVAVLGVCPGPFAWGTPPEKVKDACETQWGRPAPGENDPNVFDRLTCKQQGLVNQLGYMVDNSLTQGPVSGPLTQGQKHLAINARTRAAAAHLNSNRDAFRILSKAERKASAPGKDCVLVELTGNGDGVCDPDPPANETCASTDDPPVACDPTLKHPNPKKQVLCAQICESAAAQETAAESLAEQQIARNLEDSYDALEEDTRAMNEKLDALGVELTQAESRVGPLQSGDSCAAIEELPSALSTAAGVLRIAAVTTRGIADIANAACGQTIVGVAVAAGFGGGGGGNGSVACIVVETAASLVAIAHTTVDIILNEAQDALNEQTFDCLRQAILDIAGVKGDLDASTALITNRLDRNHQETISTRQALAGQMQQVRDELAQMLREAIALLNMPQGLREEFPRP
jgi:hypothetical protein